MAWTLDYSARLILRYNFTNLLMRILHCRKFKVIIMAFPIFQSYQEGICARFCGRVELHFWWCFFKINPEYLAIGVRGFHVVLYAV